MWQEELNAINLPLFGSHSGREIQQSDVERASSVAWQCNAEGDPVIAGKKEQ